MRFINRAFSVKQLQILIWVGVFFIIYFSLLPEDGMIMAGLFTIVSTTYYLLVIYGNILFLYPRFYERGKKITYGIYAGISVISLGLTRGFLITAIYNKFNTSKPEEITAATIANYVIASLLTFMLSFIFRIAIAYFSLKQQAEQILAQKSQAELNLLKSQVQPHFLFNTLNNIYYESYVEAPKTAKLIERLSDMMRYFLEESPKETVPVKTEVQFIENYIVLEKIRIRHAIQLNFIKDYDCETIIAPMLLMTFVENIFKHGIDKSSTDNKIEIRLEQENGYLIFKTSNYVHNKNTTDKPAGSGIKNLRKRLEILYQKDFVLQITFEKNYFNSLLKIPVYEP